MENVILVIHLIIALAIIGVVLLQRSEGGGLGIGGGGGAASGRAAATALGKVTWILGIAFICTTITLTIIAAKNSSTSSVIDRVGGSTEAPAADPTSPLGDDLLPPTGTDGALTPPRADQ